MESLDVVRCICKASILPKAIGRADETTEGPIGWVWKIETGVSKGTDAQCTTTRVC